MFLPKLHFLLDKHVKTFVWKKQFKELLNCEALSTNFQNSELLFLELKDDYTVKAKIEKIIATQVFKYI